MKLECVYEIEIDKFKKDGRNRAKRTVKSIGKINNNQIEFRDLTKDEQIHFNKVHNGYSVPFSTIECSNPNCKNYTGDISNCDRNSQ